jgi:mRNA interferase MazF
MIRGEIWLCELPTVKPRPYVILTRNVAIEVVIEVTAAPLTRTIRDIATEVFVDERDGVRYPSVIRLDGITQVKKAHLTHRITMLGPQRMAQVCDALGIAVDC